MHPIIQAEVDEFEKKFGMRFNNPDDVPLQGDVQSFLSVALQRAIEKEREAWLRRERCEECGTENFNEMSNMCAKCLEEA